VPEQQLEGFISNLTEPMQDMIRSCRHAMTQQFSEAVQLVYDNKNFSVIGFGRSERASDAILSLRDTRLDDRSDQVQLPR
jgi:hypothetical protein